MGSQEGSWQQAPPIPAPSPLPAPGPHPRPHRKSTPGTGKSGKGRTRSRTLRRRSSLMAAPLCAAAGRAELPRRERPCAASGCAPPAATGTASWSVELRNPDPPDAWRSGTPGHGASVPPPVRGGLVTRGTEHRSSGAQSSGTLGHGAPAPSWCMELWYPNTQSPGPPSAQSPATLEHRAPTPPMHRALLPQSMELWHPGHRALFPPVRGAPMPPMQSPATPEHGAPESWCTEPRYPLCPAPQYPKAGSPIPRYTLPWQLQSTVLCNLVQRAWAPPLHRAPVAPLKSALVPAACRAVFPQRTEALRPCLAPTSFGKGSHAQRLHCYPHFTPALCLT